MTARATKNVATQHGEAEKRRPGTRFVGNPKIESLMGQKWKDRSPDRLADPEWTATLLRVRAEFDEMPCLRVSAGEARMLFGLTDPLSNWVLTRLIGDGFLECRNGEYLRRSAEP